MFTYLCLHCSSCATPIPSSGTPTGVVRLGRGNRGKEQHSGLHSMTWKIKCYLKEKVANGPSDSIESRAPVCIIDWPDRTIGLGPDRTGLILVRSGPKVKDRTVKQSPFLVRTGLKLL